MKMKKFLACSILSIALLASGCGNKTSTTTSNSSSKIKDGGSIVFSIRSDPQAMNPLYASDRNTMTINNALFSPLYVMNGDKIEYYLADNVSVSSDFLNYTLKLKKNLKWHDGKPLTSEDLIFTIDKVLDEKQNSFLRESFILDGKPVTVKKIDETTVEFKLPSVSAAFMSTISQISPIPKHIFEGEADISKSSKNESPVGSGPFKFKEFKKGESLTLTRNNDYFGGKPHLDSVIYRVIGDENSSNIALQNGEIGARYILPKDAEKYKNDKKFNLFTYSEGMVDNLILNCASPSLQKKEVRQAIAYAINKDDLIKTAYISNEYADKAYSILTPDTLCYTNDVNKFEFNQDKAKELLNKAGVKDLNLKILYLKGTKDLESESLLIQQNLKDIGIKVDLVPMDAGAFYKKVFDPSSTDYDLVLNSYVNGSEPDNYKGAFITGEIYNGSKYANKEVDDLWKKGAIETDKGKREQIYKNIQKIIVDDMPLYPIAYSKSVIAVNKKYGGIKEAKTVPIFMFQDLSKLYIAEE